MRSQLGLGFLTTTLMVSFTPTFNAQRTHWTSFTQSAAVQARPQLSTTVISTSTTTHPNPTTSDSTTSTTDGGTTTDFPPPTPTSYPCATSTQWELGVRAPHPTLSLD